MEHFSIAGDRTHRLPYCEIFVDSLQNTSSLLTCGYGNGRYLLSETETERENDPRTVHRSSVWSVGRSG